MKRVFNVIRFNVGGSLEEEYHSDGGWIQYLPAKERVTVAFTDEDGKVGTIEVEPGEILEFTPIGYDFENELYIGNITIS